MDCPECKRLEWKAAQATKELVSAQNAWGAAEATARREQRAAARARARAAETHRDQALRELDVHKRACGAGPGRIVTPG